MGLFKKIKKYAGVVLGGAAGFMLAGPLGLKAGSAAAAGAFIGSGIDRNRMAYDAAQQQMAFQASQSATAVRRSMADYEAAGLNPMLAMGHPAQSMPGAMPSYENIMSGAAQAYSSAAEGYRIESETMPHEHLLKKLESEWMLNLNLGERASREADLVYHKIKRLMMENVELEKYLPITAKADAEIIVAAAKKAVIEGEIDDTTFGEVLRYVDRALSSLKVVGGIAGGTAGGYLGGRYGAGLKNRSSAQGLRREPRMRDYGLPPGGSRY